MKRRPIDLLARAVARTALAGERQAPSLRARLAACIDAPPAWLDALSQQLGGWTPGRWQRHDLDTLAAWLRQDAVFLSVQGDRHPPFVRRYLLRPVYAGRPAPLGLDGLGLPALATPGELAAWLELSRAGLWRLCLPAAWQRRRPLGEQHYRFAPCEKASGGMRLIEAPHPHLKAVQRRLLDGLLARVPVHEAVHGYVAGRSVRSHAEAHRGQAVLLRFDLQDFFTSVSASRVHALWSTLGHPLPVARALTALCTVATPEPVLQRLREEGGLGWPQAQRLRDAHLPQGAPTSPALANLCAFGLDLRLAALAEAFGARYTRYADDLVLSGPPALLKQARRIEARVAAIALEQGFRLNHRKTHVAPAHRQQRVCGIVVNQRCNLPREEFDRLKAVLHRCMVSGPSAVQLALPAGSTLREHLQGRLGWATQLNAAKSARLARLYERIDWNR